MSTDGLGLRIGHCSDPGRQRELNEDSYLILMAPAIAPEIDGLLAVADGMGGHQAGDVASRILVEMLEELFTSTAYQLHVAYSPQHADYYMVVLKEVLEQINERIYSLSAGRPELTGMGTTATVALVARGHLFWGHAGDSRAYLLRNGVLQRLTRDHTWVAEQVEAGRMTPEEAAQDPRGHVLTQSLGNSLLVRIERGMHPVQPGDLLLLCSDGLSSVVSDAEIRKMLLAKVHPQAACEQLVVLANQRGSPDNVTVLAARMTAGYAGSSVPGGRVLGPVQHEVTPAAMPDTLKLRRSWRRWGIRGEGRLARRIGMALVLLLGALLSGLASLVVGLVLSSAEQPLMAFGAVGTFVLGALLGWLLRPSRPDQVDRVSRGNNPQA